MSGFEKAQRLSLTMQVEANLKNALIIGALKPGARLITRDIAQQLGTSITPVREALLRLASAGALEAAPAQAFLVPKVSLQRYREVNLIRKKLEGMAASVCAARMTPDKIRRLRQYAQELHEAKTQGNMESALQANCRFRFHLYEYADMPTLASLIEQLWVRIGPCFNYLHPLSCEVFRFNHFYDDLLTALENGDEAKSCIAICRAIDQGEAILRRQYAAEA